MIIIINKSWQFLSQVSSRQVNSSPVDLPQSAKFLRPLSGASSSGSVCLIVEFPYMKLSVARYVF